MKYYIDNDNVYCIENGYWWWLIYNGKQLNSYHRKLAKDYSVAGKEISLQEYEDFLISIL